MSGACSVDSEAGFIITPSAARTLSSHRHDRNPVHPRRRRIERPRVRASRRSAPRAPHRVGRGGAGRVGEVASFEPGAGALILGRGEGSGGRVVFHRQRPGSDEHAGPLSSQDLARAAPHPGRGRPPPGGSDRQVRDGGARRSRGPRRPRAGRYAVAQRADASSCARGDRVSYRRSRHGTLAGAPAFGAADRARDRRGELGDMAPPRSTGLDRRRRSSTPILGGSGSGKELAARAVHALAARAAFVARNAATIPQGLSTPSCSAT